MSIYLQYIHPGPERWPGAGEGHPRDGGRRPPRARDAGTRAAGTDGSRGNNTGAMAMESMGKSGGLWPKDWECVVQIV